MKRYTYEVKKSLVYEVEATDEESALQRLCDDFDLTPIEEGFDVDSFLKAKLLGVINCEWKNIFYYLLFAVVVVWTCNHIK